MVYKVLHTHFLTSLCSLLSGDKSFLLFVEHIWQALAFRASEVISLSVWIFFLRYIHSSLYSTPSNLCSSMTLRVLSLVLPFQIVTHSSTTSSHQPSSFSQGYLSLSNQSLLFIVDFCPMRTKFHEGKDFCFVLCSIFT